MSDKPKYIKVKEFIKEYISRGQLKAGDKLFSENQLAEQFNISRHTVRKAIGELINEGWLYQLQGKGTFVASSQGEDKKKNKLIGVITTYLKDYIFPSIVSGIYDTLSKEGYNILLGQTNNEFEKERACLLSMLNNDLDGLIIEPTKSIFPNPNADIYQLCQNKKIPIVFIHAYYKDFNASYVIEDDVLGGYLAAKHLIEKGHRKIGGIFKHDDMQGHARFEGFVKALREFGLNINDEAVFWYSSQDFDKIFSKDSYLGDYIKKIKNYTGFVCYNDLVSSGFINLLKRQGLQVPEDYSVVSFDNSDIAFQREIKLTSIAHPKEKLGIKAAKNLLSLIHGEKELIQEKMEPELIIRNSVKTIVSGNF
ncbi:MAG TPA: GntR family transcriptional regulator [Defluviitaleaceae bacterium]|nr:GntR family transcriptional regulator [Candidatus Epulonipiscium sp.]HOQ38191.1 GntR family transcriptional regulator [Acetivibrio sp.]HQD50815.1 GntR family transcriptional regulator [Defluviitaleaceae bacterium]